MDPKCQVESIYGHIFVKHFHILIIFGQMIANGDTKDLITPNDLDWTKWPNDLKMTLEEIFFSACPSFNHIFSPELCKNGKICSPTMLSKAL